MLEKPQEATTDGGDIEMNEATKESPVKDKDEKRLSFLQKRKG